MKYFFVPFEPTTNRSIIVLYTWFHACNPAAQPGLFTLYLVANGRGEKKWVKREGTWEKRKKKIIFLKFFNVCSLLLVLDGLLSLLIFPIENFNKGELDMWLTLLSRLCSIPETWRSSKIWRSMKYSIC